MKLVCSAAIGTSLCLDEVMRTVSGLGFREIDLLLVTGWAHTGLDELTANYTDTARAIERLLGKHGLSVGAVNAKYGVRLEDEGQEQATRRQHELDALLRFMKDFGVSRASVQPTLTEDKDYLRYTYPAFVKELMRQQQYAGGKGMLLSLEPHIGSAVCTNAALRALLQENSGLLVTLDPSHLLYMGEDPAGFGFLFANTSLVHLRDGRKGELFVPWGQGKLNLPFVIEGLMQAGYDGPVSVEYLADRAEEDLMADLMLFAGEINRLVAARQRQWFSTGDSQNITLCGMGTEKSSRQSVVTEKESKRAER